ncbi:MAG: hypothetical protein HZB51_01010 [Chloroflexi bacterium]|nr:hypothetical protein [Chloroflexota bacterium]
MPDNNLFLTDQHPLSRRSAVLEDDGTSAWLYLTQPNLQMPIADVWVYNRIPAPSMKIIPSYRDGPPPAPVGYAHNTALCRDPGTHEWSFIWSADGESVAIAKDGLPVACIISAQKSGHSRELLKDGPWGMTWSEELFRHTFRIMSK